MSPTISIVPATQIDAATRAHLIALVNDAFLKHDWLFPGIERTDPEDFAEETANADLIFVRDPAAPRPAFSSPAALDLPDAPVALAVIRADEDDPAALYVGMVTVPRSLQGRGYGRVVMEAAETVARRRGLARVTLTTIPQLGNTAYYELRGYSIISSVERPAGFWGSSAPYTLVRMAKVL